MPDILLEGCTSRPLASCLKALGILRLVGEQQDAQVRGAWRNGCFVLSSSLDKETLCDFFLHVWQPTPLVSPWNGGSGFYPGDNTEGIDAITQSTDPRLAGYRAVIARIRDWPEFRMLASLPAGQARKQRDSVREEGKNIFLQRCRAELPEVCLPWLDAAFEICDFTLERMNADGRIGMSWNRDGSVHEEKGTAGAFLVLPLAEAFLRTGERRYLEAAEKGFAYYYGEFAANGYGTSGALDTCCIDKESVIPLMKGALLLFDATGKKSYLDQAEEAAWYLSSWQWHQTVEYPESFGLVTADVYTSNWATVSSGWFQSGCISNYAMADADEDFAVELHAKRVGEWTWMPCGQKYWQPSKR